MTPYEKSNIVSDHKNTSSTWLEPFRRERDNPLMDVYDDVHGEKKITDTHYTDVSQLMQYRQAHKPDGN